MKILPQKWAIGLGTLVTLVCASPGIPAADFKAWAFLTNLNQRFVYYPNPTDTNAPLVLDRSTGLIWTRNTYDPQGPVDPWSAENFCDEYVANGQMGFRLPKAEELTSIAVVSGGNLSWIGSPYFNGVGPGTLTSFWSSSFVYTIEDPSSPSLRRSWKTVTAGPIQASIDYNNGGDRSPRARCVRGGTN